MPKNGVCGVIIARFQVPMLHEGHRHLIEYVMARHSRVVVLLGHRHIQANERHPMDVATRTHMVKGTYPDIEVYELLDRGADDAWSREVDTTLERSGVMTAKLYGSRGSFIPHYHGHYETVEVPQIANVCGTTVRAQNGQAPIDSEDFRRGVVYAATHRYSQGHPTIDMALMHRKNNAWRVLLGKRDAYNVNWRFPGGFFDPEKDASYEDAALREIREEAGKNIVASFPQYIGSRKVLDWRYLDSKDKIVTALFCSDYRGGTIRAGDDLKIVGWHPISSLCDVITKEHEPLAKMLMHHMK